MQQTEIERDARVVAADGEIGRVVHVVVDQQTREVTHLVVGEQGREWLVPLSEVAAIEPGSIRLRGGRADVRQRAASFDREDFHGVDDEAAAQESLHLARHGGRPLLGASDDAVVVGREQGPGQERWAPTPVPSRQPPHVEQSAGGVAGTRIWSNHLPGPSTAGSLPGAPEDGNPQAESESALKRTPLESASADLRRSAGEFHSPDVTRRQEVVGSEARAGNAHDDQDDQAESRVARARTWVRDAGRAGPARLLAFLLALAMGAGALWWLLSRRRRTWRQRVQETAKDTRESLVAWAAAAEARI